MLVVPMVFAPQRSNPLLGIRSNCWRLDKVRVVLDKGEKSVVEDVQWSRLGRFRLPFWLFLGMFLVLSLVPLFLWLPFLGWLGVLGGKYHCLGGYSNIVFQRRVLICPFIQFLYC